MRVANIEVPGGIDQVELAKQFAWLAANNQAVPPWLSALASEPKGSSFIVGRQDAFEVDDFELFRSRINCLYDGYAIREQDIPDELEGLLSLLDCIVDAIDEAVGRET